MIQIKLDAIDSTNDYLKNNPSLLQLPDFTVVTAINQTKGRGQQGASWMSEPGKNLIASVLVHDFYRTKYPPFDLIVAVSVALYQVLKDYNLPQLAIKWPNDIMADERKIGGLLLENIHKSDQKIISILGIGLNVNQVDFNHMPMASSMALLTHSHFDTQTILEQIMAELTCRITNWESCRDESYRVYEQVLFYKNKQATFKTNTTVFMGRIQGVNEIGKLLVKRADTQQIEAFDTKQIQLNYGNI